MTDKSIPFILIKLLYVYTNKEMDVLGMDVLVC